MTGATYTRKEEVRLRAKARYARAWSILMSLIRMRQAVALTGGKLPGSIR